MSEYDFKGANEQQIKAITTVDGPLLITAGPGTGKTFTLVQRAVYLMSEKKVRPSQILMSTFTKKAAAEMITRITNELADRPMVDKNINDMYIGTFHNLCLRILNEHLEHTNLRRNYTVLDDFTQRYIVLKHKKEFFGGQENKKLIPKIQGIDDVSPPKKLIRGYERPRTEWERVGDICNYVNKLSEELVDPNLLMQDSDARMVTLGEILLKYQSILQSENAIDYSGQLVECYRLLREHPEVLGELQDQIQYFMVDEYQDTNYVQERILFLLGGKTHNICVVGDDDQALYRFRDATVENILKFPGQFEPGECRIVSLTKNYRSNKDIVDFYNKWMTDDSQVSFSWGKFRYPKTIETTLPPERISPGVAKLDGEGEKLKNWMENILAFINKLVSFNAISDYNQIAFLFRSVQYWPVPELAKYLEDHGVPVYSPRSGMYFDREEIQLAVGCLLLLFPQYVEQLTATKPGYLTSEVYTYYKDCMAYTTSELGENYPELDQFIEQRAHAHKTLQGTTDYAFSGLVYILFQFAPFRGWLDENPNSRMEKIRPARNLAIFTQIISEFDQTEEVSVLSQARLSYLLYQLFGIYLKVRYGEGIEEYEDEVEYAPSGCVSFLTIHQAKGMEFPIVIVDSLTSVVWEREKDLMDEVAERYYRDENGNKRVPYEPFDHTNFFDFWRAYYVAFSRAQNLLLLTCYKQVSYYFKQPYERLLDVNDPRFLPDEFLFDQLKGSNIKPIFSFTSHISVYDTCPRQYKFYKELGFAPVRNSAQAFGTLIHETIEDIHCAVLRGEADQITEDQIQTWLETNYNSLRNAKQANLDKKTRETALKQVKKYADRHKGQWDMILRTEEDLMLAEADKDFILRGKVDLIRGEGNTVELVDFKTEKQAELIQNEPRLESYRRQLQIYAHLVEELGKEEGVKVSKMHLYCTEDPDPSASPEITFDYNPEEVQETVEAFADTAHHIMAKDYSGQADRANTCDNCDFRYYCRKVKPTA